ncbi:aldo/keto reductase [Flavobacterium sp.]|uniref:aldo/keto reductase n=1 Tax=Flavobacterium sp. TaxID=239 RepID=UPI00286E6A67|nr:aldo/keto reductase [Flavobacterium sp.]
MQFSRIISGVMTWGIWGKNYNTNQMVEMLHSCLENNTTSFDHADIYGGYTTEASFGKAFVESKIEREKIQLISKCGIQHTEGRDNKVKHYNYSAAYIVWSVENSLRNLKTDYLDALLLHRPSPLMQADEIAEAIEKLKSEGKIKSFGVSNFTPMQTELIHQKTKVEFNQIQFSATHLQPMLDGSLDFMQLHKITPMSWNPLGSVFREKSEQTQRLNLLLQNFEIKYNVSSDVLLLAWIMQHPSGVLPVIGTTSIERLKNATRAIGLILDLEDWFAIWTESIGNKVP